MSALDKLRRLRDRLGAKSVASNWSQEPGHRFVRMDDVDAEIDRLLAEPETPEPGAFIWQCACGSRNVVSSAVCPKCGNGRPNSALPLTGPNYLDQEEFGHEPAPTDPERAVIGWVSDNCGLTVAQEAELARRLESLRAAVPTDAEVDAVISEFGIAALVVGARNSLENQGEALRTRDALRALIARRVAAATDLRKRLTEREDQVDDLQQSIDNITVACGSLGMQRCELPAHIADMRKERDEATKRADGLAADLAAAVVRADRAEKERDKARAEAQQELADLHAELDTVRDERNEARAEASASQPAAVPSEDEIKAFIARVNNAINQMCDPLSPNFARNMVEVRAGMDVIRDRSVEFVRRAAAVHAVPYSCPACGAEMDSSRCWCCGWSNK